MWYFATVERDGKKLFLVSPAWKQYAFDEDRKGLYLFISEASARAAALGLVQDGDELTIIRTYRS